MPGAVLDGVTVGDGEPVGLTVAVGDMVGVPVTVGVVVTLGDTVGEVVGVGIAVGVAVGVEVTGVGVLDGAGVVVVTDGDWIGRMRLGPGIRRPVSISAIAAAATTPTAIAPPVETPVAKACRSRRYSVSRRSRSQAGSAARRAAQLLTGAAAMPSVGTNSRPASSGPLSVSALWMSAPAIPAAPHSARRASAQLARSA